MLEALYRPIKIIFLEPVVLAFDVFISLCYGAIYLFFEAFPIVFGDIYHFTAVENGLAYLGFSVGCMFAYFALFVFLTKVIGPKMQENTFTPECFLILSMFLSWSVPLSLFLFGWTARVHWILPIISEIFFILGVFNIYQASFAYLALSFSPYMASIFAGNGFCRAAFACAFPLFGQAMYNKLGSEEYPVGWGSSLVGFLCIGLSLIPFVLYKYGPHLRQKSRFSK